MQLVYVSSVRISSNKNREAVLYTKWTLERKEIPLHLVMLSTWLQAKLQNTNLNFNTPHMTTTSIETVGSDRWFVKWFQVAQFSNALHLLASLSQSGKDITVWTPYYSNRPWRSLSVLRRHCAHCYIWVFTVSVWCHGFECPLCWRVEMMQWTHAAEFQMIL